MEHHKLWPATNIVIVALGVIISGTLGYWIQDRRAPIEYESVEVIPEVIPPTGPLRIRYRIERLRSCQLRTDETITDSTGARFDLPSRQFLNAPGKMGHDTVTFVLDIPSRLSPGIGRYQLTLSYYCNPVHVWFSWPIVVRAPLVTFTVKDAK